MKTKTQKHTAKREVRREFGGEAMRELKTYRKTGKAVKWAGIKRKLGL